MFAKTTTFNSIEAKEGRILNPPILFSMKLNFSIKNCNFGFFSLVKKLEFASFKEKNIINFILKIYWIMKIMSNKSYFSLSSLKIDLYFNNIFISSATGFIILYKGEYYLITNYHVLSWRHFESDKPMDEMLAIPNKVRIWHHLKEKPWYYKGIIENYENYINWKILNNVDIWILKLNNIPDDIIVYPIDYINHRELDVNIYPWQPLVIVWFPYTLSSYSLMPIWKSWILSSEIDFDFKWMNCFLIDSSTRWWMSGSPVFTFLNWWNYELKSWENIISSKNYYKFLWIYSSRLVIPYEERKKLWKRNCEELDLLWSDIWQVWKEDNIDIILNKFYAK